ncbi:MAG: glutaredoxin 3 [Rhodospirillaceae bacterium]|nr:glutaredoxin 3 [Rhodospirillaceae bacterium]
MSNTAKVEIYTSPTCGYCHRAKSLLKKKGVAFKEINVMMKPDKRREMEARSRGRTVPQIFINDKPIGGSDELYELDFDGELDAMLGL